MESAALSSRFFARGISMTRVIALMSLSWQDTPFTGLELLSSIALERFGVAAGWPAVLRRRRSVRCSPSSISPSQVSAPCTPQLRSSAQLPPAHPRAKIHSALILSCKRSRAPLLSPFHRSRSARYFFEVKSLTARHKRIEPYYNYLPELGGSRGRRGARAASIDAALRHARAWTGLGSARSRLARRLGGRVFRRCCGPALGGRWRGRLASARGHWLGGSARPCDRARSACCVRVARNPGGFWRAVRTHWALSCSV